MAGITTPVLATLGAIDTARNTLGRVRDLAGIESGSQRRQRELLTERQRVELDSLRDRQDEEAATLRTSLQNQANQIATNADAEEKRRQRALRRAVGRTRAQLGAQGISTADGSGEAILLGQIREAEDEAAAAERLDTLRIQALSDREQAEYRRNLLELSQTQERQRLERLARGA